MVGVRTVACYHLLVAKITKQKKKKKQNSTLARKISLHKNCICVWIFFITLIITTRRPKVRLCRRGAAFKFELFVYHTCRQKMSAIRNAIPDEHPYTSSASLEVFFSSSLGDGCAITDHNDYFVVRPAHRICAHVHVFILRRYVSDMPHHTTPRHATPATVCTMMHYCWWEIN